MAIAIIFRFVVSAIVIVSVYLFGRYTGSSETTQRLTKLYLPEECDGCKKIKPVITTLDYDRHHRIRSINIGCSKVLTCKRRKDIEQLR